MSSYSLEQFNALGDHQAQQVLALVCHSRSWQEAMLAGRPYESVQAIVAMAEDLWSLSDATSLLEALGHEQILGDVTALQQFFSASKDSAGVIKELAQLNVQYVSKFGFPFMVSGLEQTPAAYLAALKGRVLNHRGEEIDNAASELGTLIQQRLSTVIVEQAPNVSVHVVDTCRGCGASGMALALFDASGQRLALSKTDTRGEVTDWGGPLRLAVGEYWLKFDTANYFNALGQACFHPSISVHFRVGDGQQHTHIPLWLSPYGYSTSQSSAP